MAGTIVSRDTSYLVLAGIMAVALAVAIVGGLVAIVRFGQTDGNAATTVAEAGAWIFAGALLISFVMAASDELKGRGAAH